MSKKVILDNKYELGGGLGSWAKSRESVTINKGDVRVIGGILMYAYSIYRTNSFSIIGDEVNWCPVDTKLGFDDLRDWVKNVT